MAIERRSFKGVRLAYVVETEWRRTIVTPSKTEVCFEVHDKGSDGVIHAVCFALFKHESDEAKDVLEALRMAVEGHHG